MTSLPCQVHHTHYPRPHVNERHHIWPIGYHGPDIESNKVVTCATGHNTIHELLELMLKRGTADLTYTEMRNYTTGEKAYARMGFDAVMTYAQSLVPQ